MGPKQRYHHLVLHTFQVKTTSPARLLLCSVILVVQLKLSSYTSNHANHSNHTIHTTNQSLVEDVVLLTTIPVTGQVSRLFQPSEHLASTGAQNNSRAGTGVCAVCTCSSQPTTHNGETRQGDFYLKVESLHHLCKIDELQI